MAASEPIGPAEAMFRKGLHALDRKVYQEAIAAFREAIELERVEGAKSPRMKYVSYLGLTLTYSQGRGDEGVKLCEQAVKREFFDPDLYCNLGIVCLRNRRKARAFEAFQKALNLKPGHARTLGELERYECRGDPVFTFLPRSHPINRFAGQVRYRIRLLFGATTSRA